MAFLSLAPNGTGAWIEQHLPPVALARAPGGLLVWQWIALPLSLVVAWLVGIVLSRLSRAVAAAITRRTPTQYDDVLLARLAGPMTLAWTVIVELVLLKFLGLDDDAHATARAPLKAAILVAFFWALLRAADGVLERLEGSTWASLHPSARSLMPLMRRIAALSVLALGVVAMLAELGYPVTSLIAGLGIGGLAFALAAQKTVENLFGAVSLGLDRPFTVGDFVKVDDVLGTVEEIGFRSTRIRTLDRTIVTMPNGKLAEMRIESFAPRDRLRFAMNLRLGYDTTRTELERVLADIERTLREHPKIWPDGITVRFKELGDAAMILEISCWFGTKDWNEFMLIRQDMLLSILGIVEDSGATLAIPAGTVKLVQHLSSRGEARPAGAENR